MAADKQMSGNRVRFGIVSKLPLRQKLSRLVQLSKGRKRGLILTHDNPDPDSLASAVALAYFLEQRSGVPCDAPCRASRTRLWVGAPTGRRTRAPR